VCVSVVSMCPVRALSFESVYLETLFLMCRYIFRTFSTYIKVIVARSRSQEENVSNVYACSRVVYLVLKGSVVVIFFWKSVVKM